MKVSSTQGLLNGMTISSLIKLCMTILMMMIFIIPQSFFVLKLPFLSAVLAWMLVLGFRSQLKIRSRAFLSYYLIFSLMSLLWSAIGLIKGNSDMAILESMRVYIFYMVIYCGLALYLSNFNYQSHVDGVVISGALGIGLVTAITLVDQVFQMDLIPYFVKEEMFLEVGLHDGYVQMNNVNIGMLTFIVPYLLSRFFLCSKKVRHPYLIFGLVVSLVSVVIASRRIVMILVFIVPILIYIINLLTRQPPNRHWRWWSSVYFLLILIGISSIGLLNFQSYDSPDGFVGRFLNAFDTDQNAPRPLQHAALMSGFYDNFFWGSGFGGITGVIRSDERPWTFELTYSRLLFNGGLIGFGMVMLFFLIHLFLVLQKIRQSSNAAVYISLIVGFLSVSIAAASNPYLSSFDFLFALSIIPLILNSKDHCRHIQSNKWT